MTLDALQRLVLERAAPAGEWDGDISQDEYHWQVSSMDVNVRVRLPLRQVHEEPALAFDDAVTMRDTILALGFSLHSRCELTAVGATNEDGAVVGWRGYLDLDIVPAVEQ